MQLQRETGIAPHRSAWAMLHGVSIPYVGRYTDEFTYRFNRRQVGARLFGNMTRTTGRSG